MDEVKNLRRECPQSMFKTMMKVVMELERCLIVPAVLRLLLLEERVMCVWCFEVGCARTVTAARTRRSEPGSRQSNNSSRSLTSDQTTDNISSHFPLLPVLTIIIASQ
jgi:hypothetical protein